MTMIKTHGPVVCIEKKRNIDIIAFAPHSRLRGASKAVCRILAILIGGALMQACAEKTLSAQELRTAIEACRAKGGAPTPIYDADEPMRVYRLDCHS